MRYRTPALVFLCLSVFLGVMAVVVSVKTLGGSGKETAEAPPQQQIAQSVQTEAPEKSGGFFSKIFSRPTPTPEPTAEPTPTPVPTPTPWPGPEIPAQPAEATAEYFADAGFLGNSVLSGLWMYDYEDLLPDEEEYWYWDNGLTILGAAPYAAQMSDIQFGKIYVGFGNNEMSYDIDALRQAYYVVLDQLQADHPNAIIYLVSCTPVSEYRSNNSSTFKKEYVLRYNEMLKEVCAERQVWYLDAYSVLCNENGYLPSNVTSDGTHFTSGHYEYLFDYMKTHYIPDGKTPSTPTAAPEESAEPTSTDEPTP